jgi:hypothetical protein
MYRSRSWGATEWKSVEQRVPITWTACHFGGQRPWFVCSVYSEGRYYGRRVAVLYGAGDYFACRQCHSLAYASQQESIRERGFIKARKILMRLGAKPDLLEPFPEKRPRMHWCTYERLRRVYEIARDRSMRQMNLFQNDSESIHFDLLKLPHHGSNNNVEEDFFRRITASTYVVSGDGVRFPNPNENAMRWLAKARDNVEYTIYCTYDLPYMRNIFGNKLRVPDGKSCSVKAKIG